MVLLARNCGVAVSPHLPSWSRHGAKAEGAAWTNDSVDILDRTKMFCKAAPEFTA